MQRCLPPHSKKQNRKGTATPPRRVQLLAPSAKVRSCDPLLEGEMFKKAPICILIPLV